MHGNHKIRLAHVTDTTGQPEPQWTPPREFKLITNSNKITSKWGRAMIHTLNYSIDQSRTTPVTWITMLQLHHEQNSGYQSWVISTGLFVYICFIAWMRHLFSRDGLAICPNDGWRNHVYYNLDFIFDPLFFSGGSRHEVYMCTLQTVFLFNWKQFSCGK